MGLTLEEIDRIDKVTRKSSEGEFWQGMTKFVCPICQKPFVLSDNKQWTYKRKRWLNRTMNIIYICSYGCTRVYDEAMKK